MIKFTKANMLVVLCGLIAVLVLNEIENLFRYNSYCKNANFQINSLNKNYNYSKPKTHLVFLKNHKCASTTVERIFLRYSKKHGLAIVLPKMGNRLGIPDLFNHSMIGKELRTQNNKYDFYVLHSRMNVGEIEKVTHSDSIWVTIVREPVAQFESMWVYYNISHNFKLSLEAYLDLPYEKIVYKRKFKIWGIHQMFYDLGYESFIDKNHSSIMTEVEKLHNRFDLIMVAERMNESLVLLKDLMNWKTEDIAYLSINFRKSHASSILTDDMKKKLLKLNTPDVILYNHSVQVFNKKIEEFGVERMKKEIKNLRLECDKLLYECTNGTIRARNIPGNELENINVWTYRLKMPTEKCYDLIKYQPTLVNDIRKVQAAWIAKIR